MTMDKNGRLTRSEAAAALGVTPKTLYIWERQGKIKTPERDWRNWRWYTTKEITRIRKDLLGQEDSEGPVLPLSLEISARNRFGGTIREINGDSVLCEVVMQLEGGQEMVAVITRGSLKRLGLKVGTKAVAYIKATEVILGR